MCLPVSYLIVTLIVDVPSHGELYHAHRNLHRFSGFTLLFFMLFSAFFIWQIVSFALSMMRLADMYRFYTHLLHIPDVRTRYSSPIISMLTSFNSKTSRPSPGQKLSVA